MRDFQKSKVYAAESDMSEKGARFESVQDIQQFVDKICGSRWFRNRFGRVIRIVVRDGRGRRSACGKGWNNIDGRYGIIKLPRWSRYTKYILHEIAHVVMPGNTPAHGREFAKILLQLVARWMGNEAAQELRAAYRQRGVKYAGRLRCQSQTK